MKKSNFAILALLLAIFLMPLPVNAQTTTPPASDPASTINSLTQTINGVNDVVQKNKDALDKAQSALNTITTTAEKAQDAYAKTKAVIEKGQHYYEQGQTYWQKIEPYAKPVWGTIVTLWLRVTNNNQPKRVMVVLGIFAIVYVLLKFRRSRYRQFYDR